MTSVRRWLPLLLVLFLVVPGALRALAGLPIEAAWYDAVGYGEIFWTTLEVQAGLAVGVGLLAMLYVGGSVAFALTRSERPAVRQRPFLVDVDELPRQSLVDDGDLKRGVAAAAVLFGLVLGGGAAAAWEPVLLWLNAGSFGATDPVLGQDVGFYVFQLPVLHAAHTLLTFAVWVTTAGVAVTYLLRGGVHLDVRQHGEQFEYNGMTWSEPARRHLALQAALVGVVMAGGVWLSRYDLLTDQSGLLSGASYTQANITLPLLTLQTAVMVVGSLIFAGGVVRTDVKLLIGGAAAFVLPAVVTGVVPDMVQRFTVLPNELAKERPYIEHHIAATRKAWDLDRVQERTLTGDARLTATDIANNDPTVENVRLWDHQPLLDTFSQVQEIRTYYAFASVDNDRYVIDGRLRQIMLSPRELVSATLPTRARTWVNETMVYTHGYGIALGPVNQVTSQGLPELFVKDLPPKVSFPDDLAITRPEIYFGEIMENEVLVRTAMKEFDYPTGDENAYTTYEGAAGVEVGTGLWRALVAMRLDSVTMYLSGEVKPDSRALLYRDVVTRARRIAPFLLFDRDPYLVITEGRLVWMLDAYTAAERYPYAQRKGRLGAYLRNPVKVTVDAYDGTVTYYRDDGVTDPIIDAWSKAFPGLTRPIGDMPADLRAHLRYPQDLFSAQTDLFATYHMTDPQVFYNREDEWEVPQVNGSLMEPYFTIMKLPGGPTEEFIAMQPFVPRDKPNLAAWMVARSDGDNYGELLAYKFPKDKMVYGPEMVVARINQDDAISEKLSLWNQSGSQVELGTLLVIPIEEALVYVQPLYLKADQGSIPELKRVIVGFDNEIAMEETLEGALASLFGKAAPEPVAKPAAPAEPEQPFDTEAPPPAMPGTVAELAARAQTHFEAATAAQRAGDWAAYGEALEALEATLTELNAGAAPR